MTARQTSSHFPRAITGMAAEQPPARIVIFIGAPGSGKGTQSSLLSSRYDIPCISTGMILRDEAKKNTPVGFRLRQTMASGALVDDQTVCDAVVSRIRDSYEQGKASLILDGFPRTVSQAKRLNDELKALGIPGPLVIHLDVPDHVLLQRLARRRQCATCGAVYNLASKTSKNGARCQFDGGALVERDDDSEGVVARRLTSYRRETLPVIEYFRKNDSANGIYRRIDGNLEATAIASEVCDLMRFADTAMAA